MGQVCLQLQAPAPFDEFAEMAQEEFRRWLEGFRPLFESEKPPPIMEISALIQAKRNELTGPLLEAALTNAHRAELECTRAACPKCERVVAMKRLDRRQLSTLQGRAELCRPYFYCTSCELGFHPADQAMGMAREEHQWDVQQALTRLAADLPYETGSEHFERLTTVKVSDHFGHDTLNAVGEAATFDNVIPSRREIAQRIREAERECKRYRPVLVASTDGAMAPLRAPGKRNARRGPGAWQEVKGVRLYLLTEQERIIPLVSWHQLANAAETERDLKKIAARIPHKRVRIALVGDGADWVWNVLCAAFPSGREVLDYYHCSEHVHETARLQFGDTLKGWQWAETKLTQLADGEVEQVIASLAQMRPRTQGAGESIRQLKGYLTNHEHRIDYQKFKPGGLPRGSGAMESAHKFIAHVRIKRPGAWWLKGNCNSMLRIRCALYNGTFERVFRDYVRAQRSARRRRKRT
jgi:hypothetical protein